MTSPAERPGQRKEASLLSETGWSVRSAPAPDRDDGWPRREGRRLVSSCVFGGGRRGGAPSEGWPGL